MYLRLVILFFLTHLTCFSQHVRIEDKIRISEAITISNAFGEQLWDGFNTAPFSIILVTDDFEYLMFHDTPSKDFVLLENDKVLNTEIYYRKRTYNKTFLATFPAVNGVSCVVIGTPENTGKSTSEWIITLVHEHFHQYTYSSKNYYKDVNNLDLHNGDKTGMWMLNYDFPYTSSTVIKAYENYINSVKNLLELLETKKNYQNAFNKYIEAKRNFKSVLDIKDYKYFEFQLWQEGIARYCEYKFLELLTNYTPTEAVKSLKDFTSFSELKLSLKQREINNLTKLKLNKAKRVCFYAVGMAEGLILDYINPTWRTQYLKNKFSLETYR